MANEAPSPTMADLARVFAQVVDAPPELRGRLLDQLCDDEPTRQRVLAMLKADSEPDPLLDHSLVQTPVGISAGQRVADYQLLQELGRGGMGVVFEAEQLEPVQRKVALKVIKPGVDTREVIERFNAERQALSLMNHPHIAKVFDAGSTELGRPFFVMEMVDGQPITTYCEENQLSTRERLVLFLTVCQAIQHAHQKGIIHRDIKPSNLLVAEYECQPMVKVIDFGVAKAINQSPSSRLDVTRAGEVVGTYEYMSPEQSRVGESDVDTRSDIYSLGVVLYELVSGSPPFDRQRLRTVDWEELLKIIRTEEPPKPSATYARNVADASGKPSRISHEIDWIVLKAMEKDRNRRYATPSELASDVQRFLSGDAVFACPPSSLYMFRKFAQRNRVLLVTSTLVATSLILGLIGTSSQAIRASHAEAIAKANARIADLNAKESREASEFLKDRLLDIVGMESDTADGADIDPNLRLLKIFRNAAEEVDKRFVDQPGVRSDLQAVLAQSFNHLGEFDNATRLYKEYLGFLESRPGSTPAEIIFVMRQMVKNYIDEARLGEAKSLCQTALRKTRELSELAAGDQNFVAQHPLRIQLLDDLATIMHQQGDHGEAVGIHRECLELKHAKYGAKSQQTQTSKTNLASVLESLGEFEQALSLHQEVLSERLAATHHLSASQIAMARCELAKCLLKACRSGQGKSESSAEARELLQLSMNSFRELFGPDSEKALDTQFHLAWACNEQSHYEEAIVLLEEYLELLDRSPAGESARKLAAMNMLGWSYLRRSRLPEAEKVLRRAYEQADGDDLQTVQILNNLAITSNLMGKLAESISLDEQTTRLSRQVLGDDHVDTLRAEARLGISYLEQGRSDKGKPLLQRVLHLGRELPEVKQLFRSLSESHLVDRSADDENAWKTAPVEDVEAWNGES